MEREPTASGTGDGHATLAIRPWPDPALDVLGHDVRSRYSETFWLPVLGPTALLMLRRFADELDAAPHGTTIGWAECCGALGIGEKQTEGAPARRAVQRLERFGFVTHDGDGALLVRRRLPPVQRRQARRLPESVRIQHDDWVAAELERPASDRARARAQSTALCLLELGDQPDIIERSLMTIGYPATIARDALDWARRRHLDAQRAAAAASP